MAAAVDGKPVSLVDLSTKGARLELSGVLNPGTQVHLQVGTPHGKLSVEGTVLWCQIDELLLDGSEDRYLGGLMFREQQPAIAALLEELTAADAAVLIEDFRCEDRYTMTAPLTGSFGDVVAPVSIVDLSLHGGRLSMHSKIESGTTGSLRFQVDEETGPIDVFAKVVWSARAHDSIGYSAGLNIEKSEDPLRMAVQRLCARGEARIDGLSLRRKFDAVRKTRVPA
jgi:hypothetical protein